MTTDIALTNPAQTGEKRNENEERGNLRVTKGDRESERPNTRNPYLNVPWRHFDETLWYASSSVFEVIDNTSNDLHH
jgi:hypothetical protein